MDKILSLLSDEQGIKLLLLSFFSYLPFVLINQFFLFLFVNPINFFVLLCPQNIFPIWVLEWLHSYPLEILIHKHAPRVISIIEAFMVVIT